MVADYIYRDTVAPDDQFDMSTIMQADLADMEKRAYLQPLIKETEGLYDAESLPRHRFIVFS